MNLFRPTVSVVALAFVAVAGTTPAHAADSAHFSVVETHGSMRVSGLVPNEIVANQVMRSATEVWGDRVIGSVEIDSFAGEASFVVGLDELFTAASQVDDLSLRNDGDSVWLSGVVGSAELRDEIITAAGSSDSGVEEVLGSLIVDEELFARTEQKLAALTVNFAADSTTLDLEARGRILDVASLINQNPALHLVIEGHVAIATGSAADAEAFSGERARVVAQKLMSLSMGTDQVEVRGLGATRPLASNDTPAGAASNRRVEFSLYDGNK